MVHYGMTVSCEIARQYFQNQLKELKTQVLSQNLSRMNGSISRDVTRAAQCGSSPQWCQEIILASYSEDLNLKG